jgi:hypothetical protein
MPSQWWFSRHAATAADRDRELVRLGADIDATDIVRISANRAEL